MSDGAAVDMKQRSSKHLLRDKSSQEAKYEDLPTSGNGRHPARRMATAPTFIVSMVLISFTIAGIGAYGLASRRKRLPEITEVKYKKDRCNLDSYKSNIHELNLRGCGLTELPFSIFRFKKLRKLDASDNHLASFPTWISQSSSTPLDSISQNPFTCLEIIFLSNNDFTSIPDSLSSFSSLRVLAFRYNHITNLNVDVLPASSLEWLILTGNKIDFIPNSISRLTKLRKLMLSHNRISSLPKTFRNLQSLEMIRIANNALQTLPSLLGTMPKLAWIAAGGNPFCQRLIENRHSTKPVVSRSELDFGKQVGKGSGGITYKAVWRGNVVAVKIWNNAGQFSDGSPDGEIKTHSFLHHPNVAGSIGSLSPPDRGLILRWLDNARQLGEAPSLTSVTQDLPPVSINFPSMSPKNLIRTALTLAKALEYMHSTGFAHGDIYLHNTLEAINKNGSFTAFVSDLGAAFPYDKVKDAWMEKVEILAFCHLLADLATFSVSTASTPARSPAASRLLGFATNCLDHQHSPIANRPRFATILRQLEELL
mmetsp:Transcript_20299/g.30378  ORF Transcript_20299/g.30378 Transcript_20299/m.30378 type:complete len:538 (+) Transcript_20299:36-1649(+)